MAEIQYINDKKSKPKDFIFEQNEIINKIQNSNGTYKSSLEWLQVLKDFDIQQYQIFIQQNILNDASKILKWTKYIEREIKNNVGNFQTIKSFLDILNDINIKKYNMHINKLISSIDKNTNNNAKKLKFFQAINEDRYYQYLGEKELANNVQYNNDDFVIQNQK